MSSSVSLLFIAFALFALAFAAEPITVDTAHCPLKGGDGAYSYDPTSGKGPEDWGKKEEFHTCADGTIQSPIDFPTMVLEGDPVDAPKPFLMGNNFTFLPGSHNWALTCKSAGSCGFTMFKRKKFFLANVHFHSPSEHTLAGISYPMESHFVHASEDGEFVVIATMYNFPDEDDYSSKIHKDHHLDYGTNSFIASVLEGVNEDRPEYNIYPGSIIDTSQGYCTYTGSLTTPPCTEGVTFLMALNVETVSRRQVHNYFVTAGANFDGNNRPLQPLNGRNITCYL